MDSAGACFNRLQRLQLSLSDVLHARTLLRTRSVVALVVSFYTCFRPGNLRNTRETQTGCRARSPNSIHQRTHLAAGDKGVHSPSALRHFLERHVQGHVFAGAVRADAALGRRKPRPLQSLDTILGRDGGFVPSTAQVLSDSETVLSQSSAQVRGPLQPQQRFHPVPRHPLSLFKKRCKLKLRHAVVRLRRQREPMCRLSEFLCAGRLQPRLKLLFGPTIAARVVGNTRARAGKPPAKKSKSHQSSISRLGSITRPFISFRCRLPFNFGRSS